MSDSFVDYLEVARDYQDTKMALNSIMRTLDHLSDVETILCRLDNKPSAVASSKAMQGLLGNVVYLDTSSKFKPGTEGFIESVKDTLRKIWETIYSWFEKAIKFAASLFGLSTDRTERKSNSHIKKKVATAKRDAAVGNEEARSISNKIEENAKSITKAKTMDERFALLEKHSGLEYELAKVLNIARLSDGLSPDEMNQLAMLGDVKSAVDLHKILSNNEGLISDYEPRAQALRKLVTDYLSVSNVTTATYFVENFVKYAADEKKFLSGITTKDIKVGIKNLSSAYLLSRAEEEIKDDNGVTALILTYPKLTPNSKKDSYRQTILKYNEILQVRKAASDIFSKNMSICENSIKTLTQATEMVRQKSSANLAEINGIVRTTLKESNPHGLGTTFPARLPIILAKEIAFLEGYRDWILNARLALSMYLWEV